MSKFGLDESKILTHEQIAPGRKNDCSKETHELVLKRIKELWATKTSSILDLL